MDEIRNAAEVSVSRACGFAALGISVVVLALSYDLPMALQAGAVLTMMLLDRRLGRRLGQATP